MLASDDRYNELIAYLTEHRHALYAHKVARHSIQALNWLEKKWREDQK